MSGHAPGEFLFSVIISENMNILYHEYHEYIVWFRGGDLNGFWDIRTLRIGWSWACLQVSPWVWNFKFQTFLQMYINIYHVKKIKTTPREISEKSPDKKLLVWTLPWASLRVVHFEFWNPLAQLHIHIYHIPKFQNNPSHGYGEHVQTKFGRKEKKKK